MTRPPCFTPTHTRPHATHTDTSLAPTHRYYQEGGPIFLEIGGEGPVGGPPGGYIASLGQERNALLIQLEHRFYGESLPNGNVDTDNLKLLTVENALADLAGFIDWYTAEQGTTGKWFAFGGSYPGALVS